MSLRVPIAQAAQAEVAATAPAASKQRDDAAKVGREFEAILVRQMLGRANVAGKGGGYGDMAIEAIASAVSAAGGLGLGRAIEDALTAATRGEAAGRPAAAPEKKE